MTSINNAIQNGLTVSDLMDTLKGMDDDAIVLFVCDYGDHCHTQQALPINDVEQSDTMNLYSSAYSKSGIAKTRDSEDEDRYRENEDREIREVVFLS